MIAFDAQAAEVVTSALGRGNTPADAAALGGITEGTFWDWYKTGRQEAAVGIKAELASFYLAVTAAEAEFADRLIARAEDEGTTRDVLAVLERRHERWGKKDAPEPVEDIPRFPIHDPVARKMANEFLDYLANGVEPAEATA